MLIKVIAQGVACVVPAKALLTPPAVLDWQGHIEAALRFHAEGGGALRAWALVAGHPEHWENARLALIEALVGLSQVVVTILVTPEGEVSFSIGDSAMDLSAMVAALPAGETLTGSVGWPPQAVVH
jgi:hypothetical protein